jgi:hypothetical protein
VISWHTLSCVAGGEDPVERMILRLVVCDCLAVPALSEHRPPVACLGSTGRVKKATIFGVLAVCFCRIMCGRGRVAAAERDQANRQGQRSRVQSPPTIHVPRHNLGPGEGGIFLSAHLG